MRFRLFLCLLLLFCLAACNKPAATDEITLVLPSWYAPEQLTAVKDVLAHWNLIHPKQAAQVKVQYGKRDALRQKTMLAAKRGQWADLVLVRNEWLGQLAAEGLIRPWPEWAARSVRAQALPALLSSVADDEQVWAIPFDADVLVLWRNEKPADEAGDDHERQHSFAFPAARSVNSALAFLPWYFSYGGELIADGQIQLDAEAATSALDWLGKQLAKDEKPLRVAAMEQGDVFSCLAGGGCRSTIGGSWERSMLRRQSALSEHIRSYPISNDEGSLGVSLIGGWSLAQLPGASPMAADLALRFLATPVQLSKLEQHALLPVHRLVLSDPWFDNNADGRAFLFGLLHGRALPLHAGVETALQHIAVMVAQVFLGRKEPAEAVREAAAKIAAGETPEPVEAAAIDVPPGSIRIVGRDGETAVYDQAALAKLDKEQVGDRQLIRLANLCPGCANGRAVITAADGYDKTVAAGQIGDAFLEPEHLRIILRRDEDEAFTIRDVVKIVFSTDAGAAKLVVVAGERTNSFTETDLRKMAADGVIPFKKLVAPDSAGDNVRLTANDGYSREIPWDVFFAGGLHLDGMRCEFAGRESKDQVRHLARIEY